MPLLLHVYKEHLWQILELTIITFATARILAFYAIVD